MKYWISLLSRSFREGSTQLWRNKFLSFSTIILGALIVVLLNFVFGVQYTAEYSLQKLEQKADFTVALAESYDVFDFDALQNDLQTYNLTVDVQEATVTEGVSIPKRLHLQFHDLHEVSTVFETLKHDRYDAVIGDWDGRSEREFVHIIDRLVTVRDTLETIGFWMSVVFAGGGVFLMINTFRMVLFSRRDEVFIARLVGAEPRFITGPFLVEGLLIGLLAALLGIVLFVFALREVYFLPGGDIFVHLFNTAFQYEIYGAAAVGMLGAFVSVRKYLFGKFSL